MLTAQSLLQFCVEKAIEKKARDIMSIDLSNLSLVCDYFLLLTAANTRQCQAIADYLREELEQAGEPPLRTEGYSEGRWVLLDCGSVVAHIFLDEERRYYNLERLWGDAPAEHYQSE